MNISVDASLRQFARAVTADRMAGDELAGAVLKKSGGTVAGAQRAELFRKFLEKWRELAEGKSASAPFSDVALVRNLGPLPPPERLALLLSDVCGLSPDEVEYVLAPLSRPVSSLLEEGRELVKRSRSGSKAVIVEDEPLIAADLRDVLESMGVDVVAMARTAEQGAREAIRQRPDIVLADFNLDGRKTGVDAVLAFQDEHRCPVIFITGYPDEVLRGEEIEPDFVIAKPYRHESVKAAVAHCLATERFNVIDADAGTVIE